MMDRRDLLRGLFAVPIAVPGAAAVKVAQVVTLEPGAVSADMRISADAAGERFALTLFDKPWPKVGQRITFANKGMSLTGTVTYAEIEPWRGTGRAKYHIQGNVEAFNALPLVQNR